MTIREYFEREKISVDKYLIQRTGKATIIVPSTEKFDLSKEILNSRIKSVSLDSMNECDEATITIRI